MTTPLFLGFEIMMRQRGLVRKYGGYSSFLFSLQLIRASNIKCYTSLVYVIHHHYVPSIVNRSAVMDLHCSRSCATLIQSLCDIFVHSLMLSVHIVLGLPRPLLPFILPSIRNRCTPSPLITCPKYWHFLLLIVFNNDLLVFILCKTSPLVLCSFHDILNIPMYSHISKASNLWDVTLVSVHVSAPYKSVDQI